MLAGVGVMSLRLANAVVAWRGISNVKVAAGANTVGRQSQCRERVERSVVIGV